MTSATVNAAGGGAKVVYAVGLSRRKCSIVKRFLGDAVLHPIRDVCMAPATAIVAVWGNDVADPGALGGRRVLRIEDGFLRSVGLGADLTQPLSLAVDTQGLYYDASRPSDLECILQETVFDEALQARAARLTASIVDAGITKYNVGSSHWARPIGYMRVALVVGQVESDAALRYGAPGICSNLALLQTVRRGCPDAYIIYKPHPDVVAGLRAKGSDASSCTRRWCDEVVTGVSMDRLLEQVDEVHVLTSLSGFEALLRRRRVFTYGQPFYAGWGLTHDALPHPRRTRMLTLDQLVAGTLILYPRYVDPGTGKAMQAEDALDMLIAQRDQRHAESSPKRLLRIAQRAMLRLSLRTLLGRR